MGKWQSFKQMVLKKLDNHMENTEIVPLSYTTNKKFNLKWIEDLNIRPYIIKLLKENRAKLLHICLGNKIFWDMTPKAPSKN